MARVIISKDLSYLQVFNIRRAKRESSLNSNYDVDLLSNGVSSLTPIRLLTPF